MKTLFKPVLKAAHAGKLKKLNKKLYAEAPPVDNEQLNEDNFNLRVRQPVNSIILFFLFVTIIAGITLCISYLL